MLALSTPAERAQDETAVDRVSDRAIDAGLDELAGLERPRIRGERLSERLDAEEGHHAPGHDEGAADDDEDRRGQAGQARGGTPARATAAVRMSWRKTQPWPRRPRSGTRMASSSHAADGAVSWQASVMTTRDARPMPGPGQETVWDYPRPPRIEPTDRRVRVIVGGVTVADTTHALRVLETASPPTFYIPPS